MKQEKTERQRQILATLDGTPSLRVAELAQRLGVSTETIRRDLDAMTQAGLLNRTYGGAVRPLGQEPAVAERQAMFVAERRRIAAATVPLLLGARVLILGSGSTLVHVAHEVAAQMHDIMVITHSFGVTAALAANPSIKLLMLPGEYHAAEGTVLGGHTVAFLQNLHADVTVLGASGLTGEGPNDALPESAAVYAAMAARAASTIVTADHSKFNLVFTARYAAWRQVTHLVTDMAPDGPLQWGLEDEGVAITLG
jgi:DeoR family transcriptional regulator, fructose operon transcriptional repressor